MRSHSYACLLLCVAATCVPIALSHSKDLTLASPTLKVVISGTTGQVTSVADAKGACLVVGSEDRYDLQGKTSTEAADVVASAQPGKGRGVIECTNPDLGLKLRKEYRLSGATLSKQVTYHGPGEEKLLLRVSSQTMVEPAAYQTGYYYVATDDGYKVAALPFLAAAGVKEPIPWTMSTGSFVFYLPNEDRTLTHYRYRVDGRYFYGDTDRAIESRIVPGGAITALGEHFVSSTEPFDLESRYVLIDGDARDYHRHIMSQPPYSEYRARKVPEWFKHTRMFLSNVGATGRDLIGNRQVCADDIMDFLKLVPADKNIMVFFNHWTVQGDLPYRGTFRYYTYTDKGYSELVPVEQLKENIRWLKALSPRIKVGGYATFTPTVGTPPYDEHEDWIIHKQDGSIEFGGDGLALGGTPDLSTGYRDYLLDQMEHYVTDLGFDWIHIDSPTFEAVNWKTKRVAQSYEVAQFYDEAGKIFESHDAAMVQNVSWLASLWAHGSYMECQQPDRWEKRDWRIVAVPGSLAALYRTYRPGVWSNLCYGTRGIYGIRNTQDGMKGWIRNACTWWRDTPHSLAGEKVVDELLETKLCDGSVSPDWWKLQTDKLETELLQHGSGYVIPVLLHGEKAEEQTIAVKSSDLGYRRGNLLFSFDMRLAPREPLDVFKPVPWQEDYLTLTDFSVASKLGPQYTRTLKLEPLRNTYHLLTQTPAWVYTHDGARTSFLLPENCGVKISGALAAGAKSYKLKVENGNKQAQIIAYLPDDWAGVTVTIGGKPARVSMLRVLAHECVLVDVPQGTSNLVIANSNAKVPQMTVAYANPSELMWAEGSHRAFYHDLTGRPFEEDGMSCLAMRPTAATNGWVEFNMNGKERAGGLALKMKGANSGGDLTVVQYAGEPWSFTIKDDFTGWRDFTIYREQMAPGSTRKLWDMTTVLSLQPHPVAGGEITIADLHLLPAREGDLPVPGKPVKRSLDVYRAAQPPVIDGYGNDPCWTGAEIATDFYKYETDRPAEAKSTVRLCFDDKNLYMVFDCFENITTLAPEKASTEFQVFTNDHSHLFLDPFKDGSHFYEIGIDTAGTVADIRNAESGWDIKWNGEYEVKTGLNYNVGWTTEMRIPFSTLGKTPQAGDIWGVTFARIDNSKEFSEWTMGEWGDPFGFGDMVFKGDAR